jgi:hypothetical protein
MVGLAPALCAAYPPQDKCDQSAVARENGGGVLDSIWLDRTRARADLGALPAPVVEVFCSGWWEPLGEPSDDDVPLSGPWRVLEVDTSRPVDVLALAQRVDADADLAVLAHRGIEVAKNLVAGGVVPDPFGVVMSRKGPASYSSRARARRHPLRADRAAGQSFWSSSPVSTS